MPSYWTFSWKNRFWRDDINPEYDLLDSSASNIFRERGIVPGDLVYVVSLSEGQLMLGGRMTVNRIATHAEAVRHFKTRNLYPADEWIIGDPRLGTPLNLHRRLSTPIAKKLQFVMSKGGTAPLFYVSRTRIDNQAVRGVRELTPQSAALLERIIAVTDSYPRSTDLITVTPELLERGSKFTAPYELAEEVPSWSKHTEGAVERVLVNRYERDIVARRECIEHHGSRCCICGFDFAAIYGKSMMGYTHVHHLRPLSKIRKSYKVDPTKDLVPICANCHAVVHKSDPPLSITAVKRMLQRGK